jgi:hypothetical protein
MFPGVQENVKEWTPTFPSELPFWELESWWTLEFSKGNYRGSKCIGLKSFLYHWKNIGTQMSKMSSHDSFEYLKHKLLPKKRLEVKLAIWLSTTKSRENRLNFLECKWHVINRWKTINENYNFALDSPQSDVYTESYRPSKSWEFQFKEFLDSNLGVPGQNDICVLTMWPNIENTIRGKVVVSPKFGPWWILWVRVCKWLICAPNML